MLMKTNSYFFIAALGLLLSATGANAAQSRLEDKVTVLPVYVVNAPRQLPFEKQMQRELQELSDKANTPMAVTVEMPVTKTHVILPAPGLHIAILKAKQNAKS